MTPSPPWLLHQEIERAARRHPHGAAVWAADGQGNAQRWTYRQLHGASQQRTGALLAAGMPAGARVGVWMPKSPQAIAALWAVLTAGGVYVPLDPLAPTARIEALAADCALWGLFSDPAHAECARAWRQPPAWIGTHFDEGALKLCSAGSRAGRGHPRTSDDLAYILYTSGSTGVPKGVMLSHAHVLNFIRWAGAAVGLHPGDHVASHAPLHFDLSIFDLWATLSRGGEVCLLDAVTARFPHAVAAWIAERHITVWYSVPSALVALVPQLPAMAAVEAGLRAIIFAGEVFPAPALAAWRAALPHAAFHNWYGPTETNVCTHYQLPPGPPPQPLSIGVACPNFELALLDDDFQPVARGAAGDLWARGPGILAGYWGDPARTAAVTRTVTPADGSPPTRWYNTGDRARQGAGGELYFEGRRDALIKCRGYRISLLEVELALEACPGVAQAAVLPVPDAAHATGLRAFLRPAPAAAAPGGDSPPPLSAPAVRRWLNERLPAYMVPEAIEIRAALPITSTGKIDRQRLTQSGEPPLASAA